MQLKVTGEFSAYFLLNLLVSWPFYLILLIIRFSLIYFAQHGYIHPDEYFQSVEIAAGDIYGFDILRPWEYNSFPLINCTSEVIGCGSIGPMRSVAGLSLFVYFPIWFTKLFYTLFGKLVCKSYFFKNVNNKKLYFL